MTGQATINNCRRRKVAFYDHCYGMTISEIKVQRDAQKRKREIWKSNFRSILLSNASDMSSATVKASPNSWKEDVQRSER